MNGDLFDELGQASRERILMAEGAVILRGLALENIDILLAEVRAIVQQAPTRQMTTPGGYTMSVRTTSCGQVGWVSDANGYRYSSIDPHTGQPWPSMPAAFAELAAAAAAEAGFPGFAPDACLINRYLPGARLSLHQDKDERDAWAPIVSVSLGLPAIFLFGGLRRSERPQRYRLLHGDVAVWGGPARFAFHGIQPLADGEHPLLGRQRINLTFRKVY